MIGVWFIVYEYYNVGDSEHWILSATDFEFSSSTSPDIQCLPIRDANFLSHSSYRCRCKIGLSDEYSGLKTVNLRVFISFLLWPLMKTYTNAYMYLLERLKTICLLFVMHSRSIGMPLEWLGLNLFRKILSQSLNGLAVTRTNKLYLWV